LSKTVIYIHGKGGSACEAEHYKPLFPDCKVVGFDYKADTPWETKQEFTAFYDALAGNSEDIIIIANSIGAYFTMNALSGRHIEKAFFISPIVDMEKLIFDMMIWAGVGEEELAVKKEIPTAFGETLSWNYLSYVRENVPEWTAPTHILYGSEDNLTSYATMKAFAQRCGASLDVLSGGEHWFHTDEQLKFLDKWIIRKQDL